MKSKKSKIDANLSFTPASAEVNELTLTFNKMVKAMNTSFESENYSEEKALLNLADTYETFGEFKNEEEQGVCLANIGAILTKNGDLEMANLCFAESSAIMNNTVKQKKANMLNKRDNEAFSSSKFLLACRYFQKGLAGMATLKQKHDNRSLLQGKATD